MPPKPWQIKGLHAKARELALDRGDYEALLSGAAGRPLESCKDLTPAESSKALDRMSRLLGKRAQATVKGEGGDGYPAELRRLGNRRGMASQKQWGLIWSLWRQWRSGPGRREGQLDDLLALGGFLKAKFKVGSYRWLDVRTGIRVIDVLKEMVERDGK